MTLVKICGLSTPETMQAALDAGADFVGLVFFARSPRNVSLETAVTLAELSRGQARIVTLTVDADDTLLAAIRERVRPDFIQCHGNETPQRVSAIKALTGAAVIKAIGVATAMDAAKADQYDAADIILFDAKTESLGSALPGGNGVAFDWGVLGRVRKNFMLAGGLTSENVADAIRITGAPMVDVSSGVESSPGVKDVVKVARFIQAAKAVE